MRYGCHLRQCHVERLAEVACRGRLQGERDSPRVLRWHDAAVLRHPAVLRHQCADRLGGRVALRTLNGKGKLIVGYNAIATSPTQTGSHNVITGTSTALRVTLAWWQGTRTPLPALGRRSAAALATLRAAIPPPSTAAPPRAQRQA